MNFVLSHRGRTLYTPDSGPQGAGESLWAARWPPSATTQLLSRWKNLSDDKSLTLSSKALLRYLVVSQVQARILAGQFTETAIEEVLKLPQHDSDGRSVSISKRTVYRWLKTYRQEGVEALEPQARPTSCDSVALSPALIDFLRVAKRSDPKASIPELIHTARVQNLLAEDERISRTTVWRACDRMGLPVQRIQTLKDRDMKPFRYPHRMMMALADGKHFRAGVQRLKRVAVHFLDNALRFGLGVIVGTSESTEVFLHGVHDVTRDYGLFDAIYLDGGPGFISKDTQRVLAHLDIRLIHGEHRYPEGHGEIEKFHQILSNWLLRHLDGNPEIDPDPKALTLRLSHWLKNVYNHRPHEALNLQTPAQRWAEDPRELRFPESQDWLSAQFLLSFKRRVTKDNVIPYNGTDYELPRGHAGEKITVTRHLLTGALCILHQNKRLVLHPVDLETNAYERRARPAKSVPKTAKPSDRNAAHLAFQADLAPIVEDDGGYKKGEPDDSEDP